MEWYEIVGVIVIWVVGVWFRGRFYVFMKYWHLNDSWGKRRKK